VVRFLPAAPVISKGYRFRSVTLFDFLRARFKSPPKFALKRAASFDF
jgi:hypothetical protein